MTKDQINKLLKDGEIWPLSSLKSQRGMTEFYYYDPEKEENFYISEQVYKVLQYIFNYFLDDEIEQQKEYLIADFDVRKIHYESTNELKKALIEKMILEQIELYNTEIPPERPWFEKKAEWKRELFIFDLLADKNDPAKLIEILKFKAFNEDKILLTALQNDQFFKLVELVRPFYETQSMQTIYRIIAIDENIKYLQKEIESFQQSLKKVTIKNNLADKPIELTTRQIAFLYILNEGDLESDPNKILDYYAPKNKGKNNVRYLVSTYQKYRVRNKETLSIDTQASSKILSPELKDINKIYNFLEPYAKDKADLIISKIQTKLKQVKK